MAHADLNLERSNSESPINHVMDTAMWVATFRTRENERSDALFKDNFAKLLTGERGEALVAKMENTGAVEWSVVIRTVIIDQFILDAIKTGVDVIVNLGTGLDTRPYRMNLPLELLWIEADFSEMIEFKTEKLAAQKPGCKLERYAVDLSDDARRQAFLSSLNSRGKKILVLTEGVLPYLTNDNVTRLASDLHAQSHIQYWIVDYISPAFHTMGFRKGLNNQLKKAPFQFKPDNWLEFFARCGWAKPIIKYTFDEGKRLNRFPPRKLGMFLRFIFSSEKRKEEMRRMTGYALLGRQ